MLTLNGGHVYDDVSICSRSESENKLHMLSAQVFYMKSYYINKHNTSFDFFFALIKDRNGRI